MHSVEGTKYLFSQIKFSKLLPPYRKRLKNLGKKRGEMHDGPSIVFISQAVKNKILSIDSLK